MNNILSNLGYTTYYSGSPEDIVNSKNIYLIKKISGINLSNLNLKLLEILQKPEYFSVPNYLEDEKCFFLDTTDGDCIDSFNTIIYTNTEGPIGYTIFYDDQYIKCIFKDSEVFYINSIKIYTSFNITSSFVLNIETNNSLVKVRVEDEDSNKILIEEEKSYNYISIPKILSNLNKSDNYIRYTNDINQVITDPRMCITTDTITYHNGNIYSYQINNFNIKRHPHFLDKITYGIWNNNLYLIQWNDFNEFSIDCLSNINKYGNPKETFKSTEETKRIMEEYYIESMNCKYILLIHKETGKRGIYKIEEDFIVPISTNLGVIIDPLDNDGDLVFINYDEVLTKSVKSPKINQEMCGIFLDVKKKTRDYYLYNKIGSWFIFKSTINNLTVYSNINGTLTISGEVKDNPVIINDRCILIQNNEDCKFFFFDGDSHKYSTKENNFNENVIIVPNKDGKLHQLIEGFRHSPLNGDTNIPKIVCSAFGTLYYIEDNKFKHL